MDATDERWIASTEDQWCWKSFYVNMSSYENGSICNNEYHYSDVIMSAIASQITSVSRVCLTVCSGADQRKHSISASLAFVGGIHRWPVEFPSQRSNNAEMFSFDDVIMFALNLTCASQFVYITNPETVSGVHWQIANCHTESWPGRWN